MKVVLLTVACLVAAGCGSEPVSRVSSPPPQGETMVVCGSDPAPASGLDAPPGAEQQDTPGTQGLRDLIAHPHGIGELPADDWRLLSEDDEQAIFAVEEPDDGWLVVTLRQQDGEWSFRSSGGCDRPTVAPPDGAALAVWWLDPAAGDQTGTRELHVLASDRDCASGVPADGRIRKPIVEETKMTVTITFHADPVTGDQNCPGHAPAERVIQLDAPLGDRELLDGAFWPPAEPREL